MNWFKALTDKLRPAPPQTPAPTAPLEEGLEEILPERDRTPLAETPVEQKRRRGRPRKAQIDKRIDRMIDYTISKEPAPIADEAPRDFKKGSWCLNESQKEEIVKRMAYYQNREEINDWLAMYGLKISHNDMDQFKSSEKWRGVIEKYRREFEAKVMDIPVASKVNRIKEYDKAYGRLRKMEDSSEKTSEKIKCIEKEAQILSAVQGELEGKVSVDTTNVYYQQFNSMNKEDFEKLKLDCIRKIEHYEESKAKVVEVQQVQGGQS